MPIYEYKCTDCNKVFEMFFKSYSSNKTPECTSCESSQVSKLISSVTFNVKSNLLTVFTWFLSNVLCAITFPSVFIAYHSQTSFFKHFRKHNEYNRTFALYILMFWHFRYRMFMVSPKP